VDGEKVTAADVGNNFFVSKDQIGESRAAVSNLIPGWDIVCWVSNGILHRSDQPTPMLALAISRFPQATLQHLLEMNPDVKGESKEADPAALIGSDPKFFENFTLVIAAQLPAKPLGTLAQILWQHGIPMVYARSYGLLGSVRVQLSEHEAIETHPEGHKIDLCIHDSFSELEEFVDGLKLNDLFAQAKKDVDEGQEDSSESVSNYLHVPWPALLVHARKEWQKEVRRPCIMHLARSGSMLPL